MFATKLPMAYTLEELLRTDPMGSLYKAFEDASGAYAAQHAEDDATVRKHFERMQALAKEKPELRGKWAEHGIDTPKGRRALASLFDIPENELLRIKKFQDGARRAREKVATATTLIRSWRALKRKAGIRDIESKDFPKTLERPMLVLYSADWCPPCRMMRPTFARLVPFFDKADVRYCHEEDWTWRQSQGVSGIPQFVAYFPNGARVNGDVGSTTKEIWDTMNALIALGKNWEGKGELVCDENSCKIVTIEMK